MVLHMTCVIQDYSAVWAVAALLVSVLCLGYSIGRLPDKRDEDRRG